MSLGNNLISGGEVSYVKAAANLMVTDNAVLSDSPRSKDTTMNPAHRPLTSARSVHQFVRSQSEIVKFKSSNNWGHETSKYIFLVKIFL